MKLRGRALILLLTELNTKYQTSCICRTNIKKKKNCIKIERHVVLHKQSPRAGTLSAW